MAETTSDPLMTLGRYALTPFYGTDFRCRMDTLTRISTSSNEVSTLCLCADVRRHARLQELVAGVGTEVLSAVPVGDRNTPRGRVLMAVLKPAITISGSILDQLCNETENCSNEEPANGTHEDGML